MIRVYDTNALWRHDEILRIRHLEAEIVALQKDIDRPKQKAVAAVERLERLMKEMGITDLPKTGNDINVRAKSGCSGCFLTSLKQKACFSVAVPFGYLSSSSAKRQSSFYETAIGCPP